MGLVLAIDDDKNTLKLLSKQIDTMGHKIITASSGNEGFEFARSANPDVILLDIMMPGVSGFDVIKKIKRDDVIKNIPVIMLTSKTDKDNVLVAMRHGAIDYIAKPYTYFDLSKKIESAIKQGGKLRAKAEIERTQFITITRELGIMAMAFLTNLTHPALIEDAKKLIHPSFLTLIKNDIKVIDLRGMMEFSASDMKVLNGIIKLFGNSEIHIIAGKHYGDLVTEADFEERIKLYISYGDFEIFINRK